MLAVGSLNRMQNNGQDVTWDVRLRGCILPSFTHPHLVPNLYEFLSSVKHWRRYSEEFYQTIDGSYWRQYYFFPYYGNGYHQLFGYIFQNFLFCA